MLKLDRGIESRSGHHKEQVTMAVLILLVLAHEEIVPPTAQVRKAGNVSDRVR